MEIVLFVCFLFSFDCWQKKKERVFCNKKSRFMKANNEKKKQIENGQMTVKSCEKLIRKKKKTKQKL